MKLPEQQLELQRKLQNVKAHNQDLSNQVYKHACDKALLEQQNHELEQTGYRLKQQKLRLVQQHKAQLHALKSCHQAKAAEFEAQRAEFEAMLAVAARGLEKDASPEAKEAALLTIQNYQDHYPIHTFCATIPTASLFSPADQVADATDAADAAAAAHHDVGHPVSGQYQILPGLVQVGHQMVPASGVPNNHGVYTFYPNPADLNPAQTNGVNHHWAHNWGIDNIVYPPNVEELESNIKAESFKSRGVKPKGDDTGAASDKAARQGVNSVVDKGKNITIAAWDDRVEQVDKGTQTSPPQNGQGPQATQLPQNAGPLEATNKVDKHQPETHRYETLDSLTEAIYVQARIARQKAARSQTGQPSTAPTDGYQVNENKLAAYTATQPAAAPVVDLGTVAREETGYKSLTPAVPGLASTTAAVKPSGYDYLGRAGGYARPLAWDPAEGGYGSAAPRYPIGNPEEVSKFKITRRPVSGKEKTILKVPQPEKKRVDVAALEKRFVDLDVLDPRDAEVNPTWEDEAFTLAGLCHCKECDRYYISSPQEPHQCGVLSGSAPANSKANDA